MAREKRGEGSSSPRDKKEITAVELRGAAGETAKVTLEDGSFFFIPGETVIKRDLYVGKELTLDETEVLLLLSEEHEALKRALRLLGGREHSVFELKEKLKQRGLPERALARPLEKLSDLGLLSDLRFAKTYACGRMRRNMEGYNLLFARLLQKGVGRDDARCALEEVYTREEEDELLNRLAEKAESKGPVSEQELVSRMQKKGFSYARIKDYLRSRRDSD